VFSLLLIWTLFSCGGESDPDPEPPTPPVTASDSVAITVNTAAVKQEMIGFGGALSWYSNWVTDNNKVNEMSDLMFTDLGIGLGQALRGLPLPRRRIRLSLLIIGGFLLGGVLGAWAYRRVGFDALLAPALLTGLVGTGYALQAHYRRHAR
jgi:hypothetical protein